MGHMFLEGDSIRHPGPISHFATVDWRPRDWISQIVMATFDNVFGLAGVAWLFGLTTVTLAVALFWTSRRFVSFTAAAIISSLGLIGASASLTERPQVVSFILIVVTVGALLRTASDLRPRWWLAPMTGVWACMHGLWFLSPALQGAVLVGLALDHRLDWRIARHLGLLAVASLVAVAITPNGFFALTHPIGDPAHRGAGKYIQEFGRPELWSPAVLAVLLMLIAVAVVHVRRGTTTWVNGLLVLSAVAISLTAARSVAIGAMIAAPLVAAAIASREGKPVRAERIGVPVVAASSLVALAFVVPHTAAKPASSLPTAFDDRIRALPQGAVLFNDLRDGGYLMWRHPEVSIVGDGLTDQYSPSWVRGWFGALENEPGWEQFVSETGAGFALLETEKPIVTSLRSHGWTVVAESGGRSLLRKPAGPQTK